MRWEVPGKKERGREMLRRRVLRGKEGGRGGVEVRPERWALLSMLVSRKSGLHKQREEIWLVPEVPLIVP